MTRRRQIILAVTLGVVVPAVGLGGWVGFGIYYTLSHLHEAYAAWDTGTLLIEYMKVHQDRWPRSWDDLLTVMDTDAGRQVLLYGAGAGDRQYARSLRDQVAIDWTFNPRRPTGPNPITRPDGRAFPVVWEGAQPNDMVRQYLQRQPSTGPAGR